MRIKVAIIEEIAEVLERRQKDKLPALRDVQKKKLLEGTAKVDKVNKVLCKFKSITKTNELFYAGVVVDTNRLRVKLNKAAERKEPIWKRKLQNKSKELNKDLSQLKSQRIRKLEM